MSRFSSILFLWLGCFIFGCATANVSTNYDRSADFSHLKTYTWGEEQKPTEDPRFDDPALRAAIKESVEAQLAAKGFSKADLGQADFLLKDYITVEAKKEPAADYSMFPPIYDPGAGVTRVAPFPLRDTFMFQYDEGTFVLDMIDPKRESILWRGVLKGMVDPGISASKRRARVPAAVAKVLSRFPPN